MPFRKPTLIVWLFDLSAPKVFIEKACDNTKVQMRNKSQTEFGQVTLAPSSLSSTEHEKTSFATTIVKIPND